MEMQDRTIVLTGGASGIGRATALLLAREGAHVFVGDLDKAGGEKAPRKPAPPALRSTICRSTSAIRPRSPAFARRGPRPSRTGRRARQRRRLGPDRAVSAKPARDGGPGAVDQPRRAAQAHPRAARPDGRREEGKIVNISSDAGRVGSTGETIYAAAKGGIIAFTKSLARELARYRINVNCVCPGPTDTPLFNRQPERMREALTRAIPFRRIAQPEEIAEAVMFFLGRRSDYITGQVLSVSGGLTMVG